MHTTTVSQYQLVCHHTIVLINCKVLCSRCLQCKMWALLEGARPPRSIAILKRYLWTLRLVSKAQAYSILHWTKQVATIITAVWKCQLTTQTVSKVSGLTVSRWMSEERPPPVVQTKIVQQQDFHRTNLWGMWKWTLQQIPLVLQQRRAARSVNHHQ